MQKLELKLSEITQTVVEGERIKYLKENAKNTIQLLYLLMYRLVVYEKNLGVYIHENSLSDILIEAYKKYPKNLLFISEIIQITMNHSYRINRLLQIKKKLQIKYFSPTIWMILLIYVK